MSKAKNGIPADLMEMLEKADADRGFPKGTMASVMQQETGGQFDKFLGDPSAYHYGLNAEGRRVAGHTGKISTAFGPFGILESTGAQPGYGVKPLSSKDLGEQIRFAADYLSARSKQAGGLEQGLSGYGEGGKYGSQVMARINGNARVRHSEMKAKAVAPAAPVPDEPEPPPYYEETEPVLAELAAPPLPTGPTGQEIWAKFQSESMARPPMAPVQPEQLAYGPGMQVVRPDFMSMVSQPQANRPIDFSAFGSWGRRG